MELTVKISVFWDVTPCSEADLYQHFGETDWLYYQCGEICILQKKDSSSKMYKLSKFYNKKGLNLICFKFELHLPELIYYVTVHYKIQQKPKK
jgi:hypothetical protein